MCSQAQVAPLTALSPAVNQCQGTKHPTTGIQNASLIPDESKRGWGAFIDIHGAGAALPLAVSKSKAACCQTGAKPSSAHV